MAHIFCQFWLVCFVEGRCIAIFFCDLEKMLKILFHPQLSRILSSSYFWWVHGCASHLDLYGIWRGLGGGGALGGFAFMVVRYRSNIFSL